MAELAETNLLMYLYCVPRQWHQKNCLMVDIYSAGKVGWCDWSGSARLLGVRLSREDHSGLALLGGFLLLLGSLGGVPWLVLAASIAFVTDR